MVTQPPQIVRKADRAIVLQRRIACTMSPEINGYRARERCEVLLLKPEVAAVAPEPMYEKDRRSVSASRLMIGKRDPVSNDFHRVYLCVHSLLLFSAVVASFHHGDADSSCCRVQLIVVRCIFWVACPERSAAAGKSRNEGIDGMTRDPRAPEIVFCA
jgi:hypothetical protein